MFSSWLIRRVYKPLREYDSDQALGYGMASIELYDRFAKILDYIDGWTDKSEDYSSYLSEET